MSNAMYLEHFLDSLEPLPSDLQRNFKLLRELDSRVEKIKVEIDDKAKFYFHTVTVVEKEERVRQVRGLHDLFAKGRALNEDKVQLAAQTYEMVDKHIRRLDSDLLRFETEIKTRTGAAQVGGSIAGEKRKRRKRERRADAAVGEGRMSDEENWSPSEVAARNGLPTTAALAMTLTNNPADVLDMPVDPNEPTYCLCHQVSYGEMIGCDNPDCPIEWFHFGCVGLNTKPRGKWFCPSCGTDRKRK